MSKRVLQGIVVSNLCDKTVVIKVQRRFKHPIYRKFITKSKKFMAHDQENSFNVGDTVRIRECKPVSKRKCWMVISNDDTTKKELNNDSGAN